MKAQTFFTALFAAFFLLSAVATVSAVSFGPSAADLSLTVGSNRTFSSDTATGLALIQPTGASLSLSTASVAAGGTFNVMVQSVTGTFNVGDSVTGFVNATVDGTLLPLTLTRTFCSLGPRGSSLEIAAVDVSSDGDEDEQWKPLDTVTVEVDFENVGDDDLEEIFVELGLYDSNGRNQVGDLDFLNADEEEFDYGDLDEGDDDTVEFEFQVPADMDEGNYKLVVKVYSDDAGEDTECVDFSDDLDNEFYHDIDVESEDDEGKFIAFTNVEFSPTEATCGDTVTVSFDAYNIGEDDEDQVRINVYSDTLRFDLEEEIRQGLDQGDHEAMAFTFTVPSGLADGMYRVNFDAEYDYRNGVYREQLDDVVTYSYKIFGCSVGTGSGNGASSGSGAARISASLDSDAVAGEQLVVTATITNALSTDASFVVDASGFSSWADLESVSDRLVTLGAGESADVTFTFNVNDNASGEESFTIETTSGTRTDSREVVVSLAERTGFSLAGNSGLIWGIALVNVVLLIIIVVVAIRVARN